MAAEPNIEALVNQLTSTNDKSEALRSIKTAVYTLSSSQIRNLLPNVPISLVFNCMNTDNKNDQKVCAEILQCLLSSLSAPVVLEHFNSQVLAWLKLENKEVQALAMPLVSKLCREAPEQLCQQEELVLSIAALLRSESIDIGPAAAAALTHLGRNPNGLQILYSDHLIREICVAMETSDTCRFRVYQMATDLSILNPSALQASLNSGLLQQLVNEASKDDILVQLNAIELLSDLATCQHGLNFLDTQGVVVRMERMIADVENNPMAGILLPGLIKFFGGLAKFHPKEVLSKFGHFVGLVLNSVGNGDPSLQGICMDTLGFIASTPEGKIALNKIGNPMTDCVQKIGSVIQTGKAEQKIRALRALASLLHLQVEYQTVELLDLTERWFSIHVNQPEPLNALWSVAQQPFVDLRVPALQVLQSIAHCPWGQKQMNNCPGFKEYLLDRSTENSKEGKEEKFALIRILVESPTSTEIFGNPYKVKLKEYFAQGPFFVLAQSEVATEGES